MPAERKPCRSCREPYAVNRDGLIRMHGSLLTPEGLRDGCPGARRPPLGQPDPEGPPGHSSEEGTYRDAANILLTAVGFAMAADWIVGPPGMMADIERALDMIRSLNNGGGEVAHDD